MSKRKISVYITLIANLVFWLILSIKFSITIQESWFVKLLVFAEPAIFSLILFGWIKRLRLIVWFGIIFGVLNVFLSVTDEFGVLDLISLVLSLAMSLVLFLSLKSKARIKLGF